MLRGFFEFLFAPHSESIFQLPCLFKGYIKIENPFLYSVHLNWDFNLYRKL